MATAKFDDGLPSNPKFIAAGAIASWLWVCGVLYCRRGLTDGLIPRIVVPTLVIGLKSPYTHAAKLVDVKLWDVDGQDFRVHDFLDWNPSKQQVEGYRAYDRERKQSKHKGASESVRIPSGIRQEADRIPYAGATHAGAKSASASVSAELDLSESEESARETTALVRDAAGRVMADGVAWGHSRHRGGVVQPSTAHARCFDAPNACARGWCIPQFLGDRWVTQAGRGDYAAGVLEVAAFVQHTLATHPEGEIGDPLKFWNDCWHAAHARPAGKPPAGKGVQTFTAIQEVIQRRQAARERQSS